MSKDEEIRFKLGPIELEFGLEVVREAVEAVDPDPAGAGTDSLEDLVDAFVAFMTGSSPIARISPPVAVTTSASPSVAAGG